MSKAWNPGTSEHLDTLSHSWVMDAYSPLNMVIGFEPSQCKGTKIVVAGYRISFQDTNRSYVSGPAPSNNWIAMLLWLIG